MDASSTTYIFEKPELRECVTCGHNSEGLFCNSCNLKFTLLDSKKALEIFSLLVYKLEELIDDEDENA
jgi:hypothetical protein